MKTLEQNAYAAAQMVFWRSVDTLVAAMMSEADEQYEMLMERSEAIAQEWMLNNEVRTSIYALALDRMTEL